MRCRYVVGLTATGARQVRKSIRWVESTSELGRRRRSQPLRTRAEGGCVVVVSLLYLLFRRALAVAALRVRSREFKELEIVVLRHDLAVLRRQISCPGCTRVTTSSLLRPAGCSAERAGRSSFARTRCWVGIASCAAAWPARVHCDGRARAGSGRGGASCHDSRVQRHPGRAREPPRPASTRTSSSSTWLLTSPMIISAAVDPVLRAWKTSAFLERRRIRVSLPRC
jgi:hypothetical protein